MKDFLNTIEDFCGDNYMWVLVGATVLLLLIVAAATGAAVKALRRNKVQSADKDNREYFLEGEYDEMLKRKALEHQETEEPEPFEECIDQDEYKPEAEFETLSDQPVCININIEHGQVKIGYGADGQLSCSVQTETEQPPLSDEISADAERSEASKDDSGREIIMEKINLIKGAPARKFGPDNLNTGRSGRIYTEEELYRQIKE